MSPLACPIKRPIVPSLSIAAYRAWRGDDKPHVLLDVREDDEWQAGHIDKALHLPLAQLEERGQTILPDRAATIVVYCASGSRSAAAVYWLQQSGYTAVFNLDGGYLAWQ